MRSIRDAGIKTAILDERVRERDARPPGGGKVSNFYALGFACLPTYCAGTQTPQVRTIATQFQAAYKTPLGNHYALPGYALADAVVAAIKEAGLD